MTTLDAPAPSSRPAAPPPAGRPPNPIWVREMRQFARLGRTPFILMALTVALTVLLCAIGGLMTVGPAPTSAGVVLFDVFFSAAYFVVTLAGTTLSANGIASEREGRTWEALQLTGLSPGVVARGKFLAAYSNIALYVVMLAPVGALPFLFGGVTAGEVVAAFAWLFVLAGLSVGFGLAISSKMDNLRGAIAVTLLLSFVLSVTIWVFFGFVLSIGAHALWASVPEGPVWLPMAYSRAPLSWTYFGLLVGLPLIVVGLPTWFLYEVTTANLTSVTEDRSTGLRRWFLAALALVTPAVWAGVVGTAASNLRIGVGCAFSLLLGFLVFSAFVFAGEPIGPSRRVRARWRRERASAAARWLGPGLMPAAGVLVATGLAALLASVVAIAAVGTGGHASLRLGEALLVDAVVGGYATGFFVFVVGLTAWLRVRSNSAVVARVLMLVALFAALAGPWLFGAVVGVIAPHASDEHLMVAAPSPIYALVAASLVTSPATAATPGAHAALVASAVSAGAWALLGAGLLARAGALCRAVIRAHEEALARGDATLAAEDAHARGAQGTEGAP